MISCRERNGQEIRAAKRAQMVAHRSAKKNRGPAIPNSEVPAIRI
jgi:hypothetical protein